MNSVEFRAARLRLGLNQGELGRIMGMPRAHISRIETDRQPTAIHAAFIAVLLRVDVRSLLTTPPPP